MFFQGRHGQKGEIPFQQVKDNNIHHGGEMGFILISQVMWNSGSDMVTVMIR
jgi:hypothetical protein